jgi:hypothetical protein
MTTTAREGAPGSARGERRLVYQALGLGAALTAVTGLVSALFPNSPLWTPGFVVAFVLNGGGHESYLTPGPFWAVVVLGNLVLYSTLSWVVIRIATKGRYMGR